ncbi:MAG: response regulator [Sphingobium sp.]
MPHRTVLLVEDEPVLRKMLCETLVEDGFSVEVAETADAAWEKISGGLTFQMLLTDVRMPGRLDGLDLARKVKNRAPPVSIIVMSGYIGAREMDSNLGTFIAKPFTPLKMMQVVTDAMPPRTI